ncbi:hypothetical protein [Planobispora takensis]|uniref:Uncharacterized protein n=1 Tax=Planobispora takensis TaxID=1367882 RepID=A0A8J3WT10_9ACTN|nr:hypothetical protein [Planobispora takensis]GIH99857.1 hypothetical protein Pta02_18660 [Planobispora takensis]
MPLTLRDNTATITGTLTVEEVEPLAGWLRSTDRPRVNLRGCTHLHTGALQLLLFFRPTVVSRPLDPFLSTHIMPLLGKRNKELEASS